MRKNEVPITTFVINLKSRTDRRLHIEKQFSGRNEYNVSMVEAIGHETGAIGLWNTIKKIIFDASKTSVEYVLLCEDDHCFTGDYSCEQLFQNIKIAQQNEADILLGGVSWFKDALQVADSLFWITRFSGLQFAIIFKKFFPSILETQFELGDAADFKIAELTDKKYVVYPFISIQNEFGYSDVTGKNNAEGHVKELFEKSTQWIQNLYKVRLHYKAIVSNNIFEDEYNNVTIPVYVICLTGSKNGLIHIKEQYYRKKEFELNVVETCANAVGEAALWENLRRVIGMAVDNDDDVIIVSESDHLFTQDYSNQNLIYEILTAHAYGLDILLGGVSNFGLTLPLTQKLFWVDTFRGCRFMVLFKSIFQKILDEPFVDNVTVDNLLSQLTSNKAVLFPFISEQMKFDDIDIRLNVNIQGNIKESFNNASSRLNNVYKKCILMNL
ncbi:hypothetical protein ACI6Q2_19630 [Chitinophagaceae bacterium LWZ2-11]